MKNILIIILFLALNSGCKPKTLSGVDLENKLMETMDDYLHKTLQPGMVFKVKDVTYYPDKVKNLYLCEFHVSMHLHQKDTTGVMAASITPDFLTVSRTK